MTLWEAQGSVLQELIADMRHFVTPECSLNNIPTLSYLNYLYVFVVF